MGTRQGRWVSWENSFFRETAGTRVRGGGGVLTMDEQGYDPKCSLRTGPSTGVGLQWVL